MRKNDQHLTLGRMITLLKAIPPHRDPDYDRPVTFDFCCMRPAGKIDSYRGYYEDLALSWGPYSGDSISQSDLTRLLEESVGRTFYGYKGGEYVASPRTAMWVANHGTTDGSTAIIGVRDLGWMILIETAHFEP